MNSLRLVRLVGILALLFLSALRAEALGLGVYGGGGVGEVVDLWDDDVASDHATFGFVLDTAVAKRSVFNYRLQIGYDRFDMEDDEDEWGDESDVELEGMVVDNTFGFQLFRRPFLRLWLGPQVRLARYSGHAEYKYSDGFKDRTDVDVWAFGFGPALGLNWNRPGGLTLAFSTGGRFNFYSGDEDSDDEWDGEYEDFAEAMWFAEISILFRFDE